MNYRCYQIILRVKHYSTQTGSRAKCWLDICHWRAGLVVTGRIRDIGQSALQSSFQTEVVAAPVTSRLLFLSHYLFDY